MAQPGAVGRCGLCWSEVPVLPGDPCGMPLHKRLHVLSIQAQCKGWGFGLRTVLRGLEMPMLPSSGVVFDLALSGGRGGKMGKSPTVPPFW